MNHYIPKQKYSSKSPKSQEEIKTYKLISEYYCAKILENISSAKETNLYCEAEIPISPEDTNHKYCVPPYILFSHGGISLGICYCTDGKNIIYRFNKNSISEELKDIELGLTPIKVSLSFA